MTPAAGRYTTYDIIVVGAGHAGCEAAHAAARMGCHTLLLTIDLDKIAQMSCNPSIGGPAKGHLVREIDALGGLMGRVADATFLQIRMLNESKGPAVRSLRAQADKRSYSQVMKESLESTPGLVLKQAMVERILTIDEEIGAEETPHGSRFAVISHTGWTYYARALILTTGTFLRGRLITGSATWSGGRGGEAAAIALGEDLAARGFQIIRLKTGTPPRIDARTIDFDQTTVQHGSRVPLAFGHYYDQPMHEVVLCPFANQPPAPVYPQPMRDTWRPQLPCYLVSTTPEFHQLVRDNLHRAPLFSGIIEGVGPRYCPSIEDKIVRFANKESHGLFLEPEGWRTHEVYVQGCNTSLPEDVQWAMLRSISALRHVELMRIGYAIEYDAVATGEIGADLGARRMPGLYFAGQINRTTGYEEAAAQGLMAGINAVRSLRGEPPVILGRDEAYIGVLIDDLITKEIVEPYRVFTSRAEHRLLLRGDNADLRLTPLAYSLGLVDRARADAVEAKRTQSEALKHTLSERKLFPTIETNEALLAAGLAPLTHKVSVMELLRRPHLHYAQIQPVFSLPTPPNAVIEQVELEARYGGYIERQQREAERVRRMERRTLPPNMNYEHIKGLRTEARLVLKRIRPATLGQASRLAGVTPSDIAILLVALERYAHAHANEY